MKIVLLILLMCVNIFASTFEKNYNDLNTELDNISTNLSIEDKVSLYYLVLSTHEKISTSLSSKKTKIDYLNILEEKTLKTLSKIHKNNSHITQQEIERIKKLYIAMKNEGTQLIKESSVTDDSSSMLIFIFSFLTLLVGLFIGYFISYKIYEIRARENDPRFIIEDLQNQNTNLQYKLDSLQMSKESEDIKKSQLD